MQESFKTNQLAEFLDFERKTNETVSTFVENSSLRLSDMDGRINAASAESGLCDYIPLRLLFHKNENQ